ncbi:MAG: MBL fold metallo-hydrolase [Chloroflexi bacterium]|jgi:L-ascorbate metabolism protein UlaG (beta-lactamase superfamily)|nr:MBL fold metallo-hydrolase [Chloroflexota bacterium]
MKIKWLGHASFLITAEDGTKIITDPYGKYDGLNYAPISESADVVLVSHQHGDHVGGKVGGNPQEIARAGSSTAKGIEFNGIASYHDQSSGKERGDNTMFCFAVDGVRVCHLGDLGHVLSNQQVAEIGQVNVLLIPVGGFFTIDAQEASLVCNQIMPKVIIPMHVSNSKCGFPIAKVDEFIQGKSDVEISGVSEQEFKNADLPEAPKIVVLEPAC